MLIVCLVSSCTRDTLVPSSYNYPDSKYWAHGVNTVEQVHEKATLFDGLEVDLNYNEYQNKIFVGHELWDTVLGLSFDMWLDSLPHPIANHLWLDIKNLTPDNATHVTHLLLEACRHHNIQEHLMVESKDHHALSIVKDSGLHVILWVVTPYWSGASDRKFRKQTQSQIDYLNPDALSGDSNSFHILSETFPNHNIHIWDTPREYNDTNVAHSRMIAAHPSVKVVLVDYPEPVENRKLKIDN